jgi:drug/metabolite transporter (DMT)-like permease
MSREAAGFAASLLFVCLASVRDVYLGGLFQRVAPPVLALAAFSLCAGIFLPLALVRGAAGFGALRGRLGGLVWVNVTTGLAWISFFHALQITEPMLVQILFAGVGPLSVGWLDRRLGRVPTPLGPAERRARVALAVALACAVAVALGGRSGIGDQPWTAAVAGVALALGAGISISASTVLCRDLHDAGVAPAALVSVRFLGAFALAAVLGALSGDRPGEIVAAAASPGVLGAAIALVVIPVYVSQVGISLASPFTVRVVLAAAPALVFALQLVEGRLSPSPWSIGTGAVYGACAVWATLARQRAIAAPRAPALARPAAPPYAHVSRDARP